MVFDVVFMPGHLIKQVWGPCTGTGYGVFILADANRPARFNFCEVSL